MTALGDAIEGAFARFAAGTCLVCEDEKGRAVRYAELAALVAERRGGERGAAVIDERRTPEAIARALAAILDGRPFSWLPAKRSAAQRERIDRALAAPIEGAACVLFTSGSTGGPKGVLVGGDDLLARARGEIEAFAIEPGEPLLGILPFAFDVGLNQLFASLLAGATLHLAEAWLPADVGAILARGRIRGLSAVPSVWSLALGGGNGPLFPSASDLRYVTVSGGSLAPSRFDELARRLGPRVSIHKTYGQTETFRSTIALSANDRPDDGSVGRALPGVRVHVALDRDRLAAPGEAGEILHEGSGAMLGYLGDGELTLAKIGTHAALGEARVIYTGDRGRLDGEGRLFLLGRGDGMIKSAEQRFYPREIEEVLARHPAVREAVAFGVPDVLLGERAAAVVLATPGTDPRELRRFAASQLPSPMVPVAVAVWPALPRTASGKPAVAEIRDAWLAGRI